MSKAHEKQRREAAKAVSRRIIEAKGDRTRAELARQTGIAEATLYRYERGMMPGGQWIPVIASALGVSCDWLLTGEGEGPGVAA